MASQFGGYAGKVITIDLTHETVCEYPWSDRQRELYLGGKIMALRILYDILSGSETPFSEENPVIISTGPLTGTGAPSSVRFDVTALSPITGLPASSNCGGQLGLYLKKAGYDAVILTGRCREKRWLEIQNDSILFHDATSLWGSTATDCRQQLSSLIDGRDHAQFCIGPAGENLVHYAAVIGDNRAAGRTGIGAVLGWKNLKAVVVSGSHPIPLHNKEKTAGRNKDWFRYLHGHPLTGGKKASDEDKGSCIGCPIHCGKQGKDDKTSALEALCPIGASSYPWATLLNDWGMDTIAAADAVAWAVEASKEDVFPFPITITHADDLYTLLKEIAFGRGAGKALGLGADRLSREYKYRGEKGKGGHDGHRRRVGYQKILEAYGLTADTFLFDTAVLHFDLTEAISAAGQCMFTVSGCCSPELLLQPEALSSRLTRAVLSHCGSLLHFVNRHPRLLCFPLPILHQIDLIRYATGMRMTPGRFIEAGRRSHTLERMICCRFGGKGCRPPKQLPKDMQNAYCRLRGWDENGTPSLKTLKALHID